MKAIIILGGGVNNDGSLPEEAKKRVEKGVSLYKPNSFLVLSGKWSFLTNKTFPRTEAKAMKEYALSLGAEEKKIVLEEKSQDTLGNAYFCKKIVDDHHWDDVIVVTSQFHEQRASFIFEKAFGKPIPFKTTPTLGKEDQEKALLELTQKKLRHNEFTKIIEEDHPVYGKNPKFSKQDFLTHTK